MSFTSFAFGLLMAIVLLARVTIGRSKQNPLYLATLLIASLTFYAWHVPAYSLLLLVSIGVDYAVGRGLGAPDASPQRRQILLAISLVTNLGILAVFKYADFVLEQVAEVVGLVTGEAEFESLGWVLPMGISFYTFQSMSYTIDVYRRVLPPYQSLWKFALFVSFFPQLVAGPIVRARDFLYQIDRRRSLRMPAIEEGLYLLIQGFFLKLVVSNHLGTVVDAHWNRAAEPGANSLLVLAVTLLFGVQIFADFAGYSNIARGCAYLLGFRLPVNFASPYIATSFREFWTRWHITLSQWLRDYLYISLGGNRRGRSRTWVNLWLVMTIGGLWHGAAGHYVAWGALHGTALVIERALGMHSPVKNRGRTLSLSWALIVQCSVLLFWILFRAEDMAQATTLFSNLSDLRFSSLDRLPIGWALLVASPIALMHLRTLAVERMGIAPPGMLERALIAGVSLYLCFTANGVNDAFIYFQF